MNPIQAIILGVVEGTTEFLPISSTGHLILVSKLLSIPQTEFVKSFEIVIQSGAILAVLLLYARRITSNINLAKKILFAFLPTAIVGFMLYKLIKQFLIGNISVTLLSLFLGGVILILVEFYLKNRGLNRNLKGENVKSIDHLSISNCLVIGLIQSISVIPGVSRAGATIVLDRRDYGRLPASKSCRDNQPHHYIGDCKQRLK
jgi:undecaprenyl-diphosphatase